MAKEKFEENCGEFAQAVREHYAYLFDEYGFTVLFQDEGRGGQYCIFILGTSDCIMRFENDRGGIAIVFGSRDVHVGWPMSPQNENEERGFWIGETPAFYFFQGKEFPSYEVAYEAALKKPAEYFEYYGVKNLHERSCLIKPLMPEIIAFFQGKSSKFTQESYEEFDQDVRNKINQHYNIPPDG